MHSFRDRLLILGAVLVAIMISGTAGFVVIDHYTPFDAFYMTLITVTTIGYSEIRPLSQTGRVFNSFLIVFGVTVMLLVVGAITQAVIELELNQYFGKRRTKKMIDELKDHFILCGFGRVGQGAAAEFQR